jgi:hypothetical protein
MSELWLLLTSLAVSGVFVLVAVVSGPGYKSKL